MVNAGTVTVRDTVAVCVVPPPLPATVIVYEPGATVEAELKWRDLMGRVQQTSLKLHPGWHTVLLGQPEPAALAAR